MIKNLLYAPELWWEMAPEVRKRFVNGCGPDGWKIDLVPDTIWLLSIREACNIHDYMYAVGTTYQDKQEADRVFKNNMLRLIDAAGGPGFLKKMRRNRALIYYKVVYDYGGPSFWYGKNPKETLKAA